MDFFEGIFALVTVACCFLIWLIPIILISVSDRASGKEKLAWILAVIFISWFAWVFYLLLAPLASHPRYYDERDYRRYR